MKIHYMNMKKNQFIKAKTLMKNFLQLVKLLTSPLFLLAKYNKENISNSMKTTRIIRNLISDFYHQARFIYKVNISNNSFFNGAEIIGVLGFWGFGVLGLGFRV
jgi:hypothetical protein